MQQRTPRRLLQATLTIVTLSAAALIGPLARANSGDLFGVGSRDAARGDAAAALATGPTASYYNPAGVALGDRPELHLGALVYHGMLKIRDRTVGIENPLEVSAGLTVAVPLEGVMKKRLWIGALLTSHPDILARIIARLPTEPFYPVLDNRSQRMMLLVTLGAKVLDDPRRGRLALGLGVNVFASVGGTIIGQEGPSRSLEARVVENLAGFARVNAGLRYDWQWVHAALVYRQQFSEPFGTDSFNFVAGTDLNLAIASEGLFSPHTVVAGLGFTPGSRLSVGLDVAYGLWRLYKGPYVKVTSLLPLVGSLVGDTPKVSFNDSVAVRLGVEYRVDASRKVVLPLRAGLAFESSPVPDQPGRTNMLDGHKLVGSLGMGVELGKLLGRRLSIDLHVRIHGLIPRTFKKKIAVAGQECPSQPAPLGPDEALSDEVPCDRTDASTLGLQISNPGYPQLRASGIVLSGGLSLGVEL